MIRVKDIADMVGVSPTTVSNVIHGNTKRVSQETAQKISRILAEVSYVPNMGARLLSKNSSHIIGIVIGFEHLHNKSPLQDPFVSTFAGQLSIEIDKAGYYMMIISGDDYRKVAEVASCWNVDGLIIIGWTQKEHKKLKKILKKPMVAVDTYTESPGQLINVGIDDYNGAYQIGKYLADLGYDKALFLTENDAEMDRCRWKGFQKAVIETYGSCPDERLIFVSHNKEIREMQYDKLLPKFLEVGALAFISDYLATDAINYFKDKGIDVPEDISITGFDDIFYAELIRPQLTTVRQDITLKAIKSMEQLLKLIAGQEIPEDERDIRIKVQLVKRYSVKESR